MTDAWLKGLCGRYRRGECQLSVCMHRGGYEPGQPVDYDKATCYAHETIQELEHLRATVLEKSTI